MNYLCDPHILPTATCPSDLTELAHRSAILAGFATEIQLDISDGHFTEVLSWPYGQGQWKELERAASEGLLIEGIAFEAHLMVRDPAELGVFLARAGAKRIIAHVESLPDPDTGRATIARWREAGAAEIGLAVLIETPLEKLEPLISGVDVVQLMSIAKIGAQGQPFDDRALSRVEELHALHPELMVAVDGGISEKNVEELVRAGANRLCVGSAITLSDNPGAAFSRIYERAMKGCAPLMQSEALA